jgi:hypothetical protein
MEIEELMFAAKVFELAGRIADGEQSMFARSIEHEMETRQVKMDNWHRENPQSAFVPQAYALLTKVALTVAELRATTPEQT